MKNETIVRVTKKNLASYYGNPDGNLYYREKGDRNADFELVDGFGQDELEAALAYGDIEMIWVSGRAKEVIDAIQVIEYEENAKRLIQAIATEDSK